MEQHIQNNISRLLPDRGDEANDQMQEARVELSAETASKIAARIAARALSKRKAAEQKTLKKQQQQIEKAEDFSRRQQQARESLAYTKENIEIIEDAQQELQANNAVPAILNRSNITTHKAAQLYALQGTTRRDVQRLLSSLNINLNMQLSKADTHNLVATLLTCNETQLQALLKNKKVPIAIKIYIKRLLDDAKEGTTSTVERLWDRVFGKNAPVSAETQNTEAGLIPNKPLSREAYILIRDTLIN